MNDFVTSLKQSQQHRVFLHNLFLCSRMHERKCKLSKKIQIFWEATVSALDNKTLDGGDRGSK